MKNFIFIFLFLINVLPIRENIKIQKTNEPNINYHLENNMITKKMGEPIELNKQGKNLLYEHEFSQSVKLTFDEEDLSYIRSNLIEVQLTFDFQFEWWNTKQHCSISSPPKIYQSLKLEDMRGDTKQVLSRLLWKSEKIKSDVQFAYAIHCEYDSDFNLTMHHLIATTLENETKESVANEPTGAPTNYRIILRNLTLQYSIPKVFEDLENTYLTIAKPIPRQNVEEWWREFNLVFYQSEINHENFSDYFLLPKPNEYDPIGWNHPPVNDQPKYLNLNLKYQPDFYHLQIYKYFFPNPQIKIKYYQNLDLTKEFDDISLIIKKNENCIETFAKKYQEWKWFLDNHVSFTTDENNNLILKPKIEESSWVKGQAKIKIFIQEVSLIDLPLITNFDFIQIEKNQNSHEVIFDFFKNKNLDYFSQEKFDNYCLSKETESNVYKIKALPESSYLGELTINFKIIKEINFVNESLEKSSPKSSFVNFVANWIFLSLIITCLLILLILKFTKSKPPKK